LTGEKKKILKMNKLIDEFYENSARLHNEKLMQGWQCPVCGKVYSPYVTQCENEFCGVKVTTGNPADI